MNLEQVSFIKTSRDWFLASCLYDSIMDMDISQTIMLLETKKANPNTLLPEYGVSPFHLIIGSENRKFACRATRAFLLNGADPNIRSDEGVTPVHIAAMWGYTDVLDLLLPAGGNPWLVDYDGKNAFQFAEEEKNWEAYNLLYNSCDMEHFISTLCNIPVCSLELNKDFKKCSRCDVSIQHGGKIHLNGIFDKDNLKVQFDQCSIKDKTFSLHNESLNIILNHRKKTTIYEFNPKQGNQDSILEKPETTGTESYLSQTVKESGQNVNFLSELKIKQNKKFVCGNEENWENNISKAISLVAKEENNASPLSDESEIRDHINKNKIELVADCTDNSPVYGQTINKEASCTKLDCKLAIQHEQFQSSVHENNMFSTRSIKNFTKDSHEVSNLSSHETFEQTNIFSDIDSDISVCVMSGILQSSKNIEEMLTDNEVFVPEELTSCKLLVNNENFSSSNTCMSTALCTSDSEISDINLCSAESEILQSDSIQNSRICDLAVDVNETTAFIDSEVHNEQPTSYSHKWVEADVFSSDDDRDRELSISEEYLYTDDEEGIVLTEKRYLSNGVRIPALLGHRNDEDYCTVIDTDTSNCSVTDTDTSSTSAYNTDSLKKELNTYGFYPGPITSQTKRVYLRKLKHFHCHACLHLEQSKPEYSPELQRVLGLPNMYLLKEWSQLEQKMCYVFSVTSTPISWREGVAKTSFTYLLLDPRITCNLPAATSNLQINQIWEKFLQAIFYVGKGKRSRPYSHLYQSVAVWEKRQSEKHFSKKVERILEIWHSGYGVVCLHVFQNIIPVEAYTREAAMISALTLGRLTNEKSGEFYGPCANWSLRQKRQLGAVLLYRACQVFMGEGERQIRPADVD